MDSLAIQFVDDRECESAVLVVRNLNSRQILQEAMNYLQELKERVGDSEVTPLERFEPEALMADFVRHIIQKFELTSMDGFYLATDDIGEELFVVCIDRQTKSFKLE